MRRFSKIDEKEFLIGYYKFTSRMRTQLIKSLCKQYVQADSLDEKEYCHILSLEQLFLLYEAFEGIFRAFVQRSNKPFLDTMADKHQDVQIIDGWLDNKTTEEFLKKMHYILDPFDKKQQEAIKKRVSGIISFWRGKDVTKAIKGFVIPVFNKLKHKLMVYKKDETIAIALEDAADKPIDKLLSDLGLRQNSNQKLPENINWVVEIAEQFEYALQDLIALRLFELGVKPADLMSIVDKSEWKWKV